LLLSFKKEDFSFLKKKKQKTLSHQVGWLHRAARVIV